VVTVALATLLEDGSELRARTQTLTLPTCP
jgi:hypothetical protein